MPGFFVDPADVEGERLVLRGAEARHATRVRRYAVGDSLEASDGQGAFYRVQITGLQEGLVECRIVAAESERGESSVRLLLVAALLKGQRFDFLIEKATEVGVDSVWPACAERSVVPNVSPRKVERWRRLAHEAAKQCGRTRTPLVADPVPLDEAMRRLAGETQQAFMAVPAAEAALEGGLGQGRLKRLGLCIGPEGGFSPAEEGMARELGFLSFGWGQRVLRAETAAVVLSGLLLHAAERANEAPSFADETND